MRNLSATGALVEGDDVPSTGTQIVLRRGELEAFGSVVWAGAGKAGLTFREPQAVARWLPENRPKRQSVLNSVTADPAHPPRDEALSPAALVLELSAVQAQLSQFGEQLARDAVLIAKHADGQLLAAAEQRIARIIASLLVAENDRVLTLACAQT